MGEYGPQLVHTTFSLVELKQLKAGLGNYSDNKDKHRNAFQHLNLAYKLTCKDTTVVLGQTLSDLEQEKVIREAQKFADTFQLSNSKHSIGENSISTGSP